MCGGGRGGAFVAAGLVERAPYAHTECEKEYAYDGQRGLSRREGDEEHTSESLNPISTWKTLELLSIVLLLLNFIIFGSERDCECELVYVYPTNIALSQMDARSLYLFGSLYSLSLWFHSTMQLCRVRVVVAVDVVQVVGNIVLSSFCQANARVCVYTSGMLSTAKTEDAVKSTLAAHIDDEDIHKHANTITINTTNAHSHSVHRLHKLLYEQSIFTH